MKQFLLFIILLGLALVSFTIQFSAKEIIDKAIEQAGGSRYDNAIIHFTFRDKLYRSKRNDGAYELERTVNSFEGAILDVVSNSGLKRTVENCPVTIADSLITRISDGVNSVHYFATLPYGLNAPAVHKKLVTEGVVKGEKYYKIKVTFDKEGGGTDYEDEFLYWIHQERFTVDYLAYKYAVNGGGIRFREAYNPRVINGIRFVDYNNYKPANLNVSLSDLDNLFNKERLELLSKIELKDVFVYINDDRAN